MPWLGACASIAFSGCGTTPGRPDIDRPVDSWIAMGRTTREDTILALGAPRASFEQDSVLVYAVACPRQKQCATTCSHRNDSNDVEHQLVLIFDPLGVLEECVLLPELPLPTSM